MKHSFSGEDLRRAAAPSGGRPSSLAHGEIEGDGSRPSSLARATGRRVNVIWWVIAAVVVLAGVFYLGGLFVEDDTEVTVVVGPPLVWCAKDGEKVEVSVRSAVDYLTPSSAEMRQLYKYVIESPFVVRNPDYYKRVSALPFYYVATNDVVNAGAVRRGVEKDGKTSLAFETEFYGGAARYARLVGLAAALQDSGQKEALKKFIALMPRRLCCRCTEKDALELIEKGGLVPALADVAMRQRAVSYSSGTIVSIISHEIGHHALGHLMGFYEKTNLEIERNQEREADSFSSSVISSSPFGEYVFAGTLFWHYALAMQGDGDSDLKNSHPLSKERFENFVRANSEKAAAMGIVLK